MTTVDVREARDADVPRILEIVEAAYRGPGGWTTEEGLVAGDRTSTQEVLALIQEAPVLLLVAETDEDLVGCCYTRRVGDVAELGLFAVDPSQQSGGMGRLLIEEHAARLAAAGVRELELHVLEGREELIAWYRRRGFAETGASVPFPGDPAQLSRPGSRFTVMVRSLGDIVGGAGTGAASLVP